MGKKEDALVNGEQNETSEDGRSRFFIHFNYYFFFRFMFLLLILINCFIITTIKRRRPCTGKVVCGNNKVTVYNGG